MRKDCKNCKHSNVKKNSILAAWYMVWCKKLRTNVRANKNRATCMYWRQK